MKLFNLPPARTTKQDDKAVASKTVRPQVITDAPYKKNGQSVRERVETAVARVDSVLGSSEEKYISITTEQELDAYVTQAESNGIVAIDTETTGTDCIADRCIGFSLFTPGQKPAYIPLLHVSYVTGIQLENQLTYAQCVPYLERLAKLKTVWHNAKFDIRILKNNFGIDLMEPYWCCMIAGRVLNENEDNSLKALHAKYVEGRNKQYDFGALFGGIDFRYVPVKFATIYAAQDAVATYEVYEYQQQYLDPSSEECKKRGLERMGRTFMEIEMPIQRIVAKMEELGVALDDKYTQELDKEYSAYLKTAYDKAYAELDKLMPIIEAWNNENPKNQVKLPVNFGSPVQLKFLLYTVLGWTSQTKTTNVQSLKEMGTPLTEAILEIRHYEKLLGTYIQKLPRVRAARDNKVHTTFNPYGAGTGRFSSNDPNLQNIPSRDKRIRQMFIPDEGYLFVGGDFSKQEPAWLAEMSQDKNLIDDFKQGRDIYAVVASRVYNLPYEECLEFFPDGTPNLEGGKRRSNMKDVILGIMYRRGAKSIADKKGWTIEVANDIIAKFHENYPEVNPWQEGVLRLLHECGYSVERWGRKRRLPDGMKERYTLERVKQDKNFDPLAMLYGNGGEDQGISDELADSILDALWKCRYRKEVERVKARALSMGIKVHDNGGYIAEAERQAINFCIQGSAATQTKLAMIAIDRDPELQALGVKLCLQIHDEVIAQVPRENAEKAAERMSYVMTHAAKDYLHVPIKCDTEVTERWYGEYAEDEEEEDGE